MIFFFQEYLMMANPKYGLHLVEIWILDDKYVNSIDAIQLFCMVFCIKTSKTSIRLGIEEYLIMKPTMALMQFSYFAWLFLSNDKKKHKIMDLRTLIRYHDVILDDESDNSIDAVRAFSLVLYLVLYLLHFYQHNVFIQSIKTNIHKIIQRWKFKIS